jgi:hypothetical protein
VKFLFLALAVAAIVVPTGQSSTTRTFQWINDTPEFDFDSSDPGPRHFGYNNEDSEATTKIRFSYLDKNGVSRARFLKSLCKGTIRFWLPGAPQFYGVFRLNGIEPLSDYIILNVSYVKHTSEWGHETAIKIKFTKGG